MSKYPVPRTPYPVASPIRWRIHVLGSLVAGCVWGLGTGYWFLSPTVQVASGSMAPTFLGPHRCTTCPHCGAPVRVGLHPRDRGTGEADPEWYRRSWCGNCGQGNLKLHTAAVQPGDRLRIDHSPKTRNATIERWKPVVFRHHRDWALKRVVGLPGERVSIQDGDVWINGQLCRKSPAEVLALRQLVFDSTHPLPFPSGRARWQFQPEDRVSLETGGKLRLRGVGGKCSALFVNRQGPNEQCRPFYDEYPYNGAHAAPTTPVQDFLVELEFEILRGGGNLHLTLTDGEAVGRFQVDWRADEPHQGNWWIGTGTVSDNPLQDGLELAPERKKEVQSVTGPGADQESRPHYLGPGRDVNRSRRQKMRLALVDRRLTAWCCAAGVIACDFAPVEKRRPVAWPFAVGVEGAEVVLHRVRLYRDIHYTDSGRNGVGGNVVPLGADEYFVLGDNSPLARDSRHWPGGGILPRHEIVGVVDSPSAP